MADKKPEKPKKPSFTARMKARGQEAASLGRTLKDEPRSFPGELFRLIKKSFRTVWDARGGGLYAVGFIVTFVYLEIRMVVSDIAEADSVGGFISEQAFEMMFRYLGESIANTVQAFIWPVHVINIQPPWGILGLVAAFYVFDQYLKSAVEEWLFGDDDRSSDLNDNNKGKSA